MNIEQTDLNFYEVGGSVRDRLMDEEPSDRDFVIVGHTVEAVEAALGDDSQVVGADFPVFLDSEGKECAMARTEEKEATAHLGNGEHQAFEMHTSPDVTLEEDLARRDLTINAMARDPETGDIVDPFDGQKDVEAQCLRHTTTAFTEDPLRVIRVARFAATLPDTLDHDLESDFDNGWWVHPHTKALCRNIAPRLDNVAPERIAEEVLKALKRAEKPSKFFRVLVDLDALSAVMPELERLRLVPAGPEEYHAEGTAFEHTMRVLDHSPATVRCRLAAIAHDLGKGQTPTAKHPAHHGHDQEGVHVAGKLANRLKLSNEYAGVMQDAAEQHMRFMDLNEMGYGKVLDLVERLDRSEAHISPVELLELCDADGRGREPQTPIGEFERLNFIHLIANARMTIDAIGGAEVLELHSDKEPGEWVGERVHQLRVETLREAEEESEDVGSVVADTFPHMEFVDALNKMRDSPELMGELDE